MGWDLYILKMPIFGQLIEKNIVARTMRTLGTLVASGVPILEALHITRETSGNAVFETALPEGLRVDPRGRIDRHADEANTRGPSSTPWRCSSGSSCRRGSAR